MAITTALVESFFPHSLRVPAMQFILQTHEEHIPKEAGASGFVPSPFMWTEIFEVNARRREVDGFEQAELSENTQVFSSRPASQCMERTQNIAVTT